MNRLIVCRELAQPGQQYSVLLFNLSSCTYLKIKDILHQYTYKNICNHSTLSQRKNSSNTCCMHRTRVTPFTSAIYRKRLVFVSKTPAQLRYFDNVYIFHDVKADFFYFGIVNLQSNIDDGTF